MCVYAHACIRTDVRVFVLKKHACDVDAIAEFAWLARADVSHAQNDSAMQAFAVAASADCMGSSLLPQHENSHRVESKGRGHFVHDHWS